MSNKKKFDRDFREAEILVVDDIPANLEVIIETLSSANYSVSAATSGKRALRQLQHKHPALILLDIQMPEMDGFETCQAIKANPDTADIPIIFITALSDTESIVKGFSLGAVDYLTKPLREAELLARVHTHLRLYVLTEHLEDQVKCRATELQFALEQVNHSKLQLIQHEKMSALGNLVAGVAHEINNPVGFLNGSIGNAADYVKDLLDYIQLYQQYHPNAADPVIEKAEEIDLAFVAEDLPKLLNSMAGATDRIKNISTSLRTFSRADTEHKVSANLHEGLDSTLLILKYRLKANEQRPDIEVIQNYGDLSIIDCFPGQLNQVFMNILANAIDALDESNRDRSFEELEVNPNRIEVQTQLDSSRQNVVIKIRDNGIGISAEVKQRIFDDLFTTKAVGKGTGLGLAIAQQIIVEKHGGAIEVNSEVGKGTEFVLTLPVS